MQGFNIEGKHGYLKVELINVFQDFSFFGGYEAEGIIEIKSGHHSIMGKLWCTTDELYDFYQQLEKCCYGHSGKAVFNNLESSFYIKLEMSSSGLAIIYGSFQEDSHFKNKLFFELETEKNNVTSTLNELKTLVKSKAS